MRHATLVSTANSIAGLLTLPAAAQGQLAAVPAMPPPARRRRASCASRPPARRKALRRRRHKGRAAAGAAAAGRSARALHGARGRPAQALHRPEPRGVPQGAGRDRAEKGPRRARQAGAGEGLLLAEGRGQRRRQEDRHRGARDRAAVSPPRTARAGRCSANSPPTRPPRPIRTAPNTVCSPAGPEFKPQDLEKLVAATKTDVGDWGFTAQRRTSRCAPTAQANAPVIEKLGMIFVRVMPDTAPNASQDFMRIVDAERQGRVRGGRGDQSARLRPALLRQGRDRRLEDRRHDRRRVAVRGALRPRPTPRRPAYSSALQRFVRQSAPLASSKRDLNGRAPQSSMGARHSAHAASRGRHPCQELCLPAPQRGRGRRSPLRPPPAGAAAADRDQEGRRHRRRLHLPQWQSSVDVHRHQGRRDRDRPDRLWPPDRRAAICRRDQEGHRQADQVPDLQPPPLRSHRRRQGVQGCRRAHHRRTRTSSRIWSRPRIRTP